MRRADCKDATTVEQANHPRAPPYFSIIISQVGRASRGMKPLMELRIRDARGSDLEFIIRANSGLAVESEGVTLDPALLGPGVAAVFEDPARGRYFIAESGDRPVGQMMLTFEWSDWRNGVFWWIQSVFVEPSHRRKGVFSKLYRHVSELAAASPEVCGLRLYVDRSNSNARSIYRHLGLYESNYEVMEIVFRGPESHSEP
jgi:GNAT superfamily N-acetyltransferase